MNALRASRTSFVIAHRLSTIRGADLIVVMEHGRIVEQGTHHELLSHDGPYFNLYNSQFVAPIVDERRVSSRGGLLRPRSSPSSSTSINGVTPRPGPWARRGSRRPSRTAA